MTESACEVQSDILIVDDAPSDIALVAKVLEERGHKVFVAQDGEEGLKRAELVCPDLILVDVRLPRIDGLEVCRRLKLLKSTQSIPVIFMTVLSDTQNKIAAFKAGAVDYVTKPLQVEEVIARVETQLELAIHRDNLQQLVADRTAELVAANDALRLHSRILDRSNDAAYLIDLAGRVHYVNQVAYRRLGYTEEQLLALSLGDIDIDWPLDQRQEEWMAFWKMLRKRDGMTFETRHKSRDGRVFPVEVTANYLEYDGGHYILGLVRDITKRKRAEHELKLLNHALDHAFDAAYLLDDDLNLRYANEAATRALGYSGEQLLSMNLLDIDPDVSCEEIQELMRQTRETGCFSGVYESRHRRSDGVTFPIEIGATTFTYEGETLYLTIVRDISERKEVERQLHAQQQALIAVAENSPDGIVRYNRAFRRVYVNDAMRRALGITEGQMLGAAPADNTTLALPEGYRQRVCNVLETGEEQHAELSFLVNGETRWADLRFVPEFDKDGQVESVLAVGREVTERKQMEQALIQREQEFRNLAESSPDNIIRYDLEGRILYLNKNLMRILGLGSAEEILGRRACDVWPDHVDTVGAGIAQAIDTGESASFEVVVPVPGAGIQYHQIIAVSEQDVSGKTIGAIAFGRDVTSIRENELLLKNTLENLPGLVYTFSCGPDGAMSFPYISPKVEAFYHITPEQAKEDFMAFHGLVHPDDRPRVEAAIAESAQHLTPFCADFRVCVPGEPVSWLEARSLPSRQDDGNFLWHGIMLDITGRKQMEQSLAKREQEFRSLAESSPDNIIRYDLEGRILYLSSKLLRLGGFGSAEEVLGKRTQDLWPDGRFQIKCEHIKQTLDTGEPTNFEVMVPIEGVSPQYHQIIIVPERDVSGKIIGAIAFGRDITAIRESELLLKNTLGNLPGLVYSFRQAPDGTMSYPYVSQKLEVFSRLTPDQVRTDCMALHGLVHPDDWPRFEAAIAGSARNMTPFHADFRVCVPGEPISWLEARSLPSRQDDGSILWHGIMLDITKRKQVEEALHEERGLFIGGPTVVFKRKAQEGWPVEYVSPNVYEQFGYTAEEFTRGEVSFATLIHPDDLDRIVDEVAEYTAQGLATYVQEFRIMDADDSVRWIYDFTVVIRGEEGSVSHYHCYVTDRTAHKLAEKALKDSEQRYRTLAENLPDNLIRYNLTFRAVYVNPLVANALGRPAADLVGKEVFELLQDHNEARHYRQALERVMKTGRPEQIDITLPNEVTGRRILQISFVAERRGNGEIRGALAIGRDITLLKETEKSLEESNAQLREVTRRRETAREEERKHIARELHDDLGQYLTALRLQTSVLSIEYGADNPTLKERLEKMLALVDKTKIVVRSLSQRLRSVVVEMGLGSALASLVSDFGEQYGLDCTLNLENGTDGIDDVSAIAFYRAVQESLTNIARHAEAQKVDITLQCRDSHYILEIRDDGKGYEPSQISCSSFGLLGMRERVKAVGGELEISSNPLQGTRVIATVPQVEPGEKI